MMDDLDEITLTTALEIARMVLSGSLGQDVCAQTLDQLDISDDEADKMWSDLELAMA